MDGDSRTACTPKRKDLGSSAHLVMAGIGNSSCCVASPRRDICVQDFRSTTLKDLNRYQGREKPSWVKIRKRLSAGNGTLYAFDAKGRISCIHRPTVEGGEMLQRQSTKEV